MKNIRFILIISCILFFCLVSVAGAGDLMPSDMGYMVQSDYGFYLSILGVACAIAFIIGFHI